MKQHVGHGVAIEGEVEGFAQARVGSAGLGVVEAQGEKRGGRRTPDAQIILARFSNQIGRNVDDIGAADLKIENLAKSGITESDLDGVHEGPACPGVFVGAEFHVRGLEHGGIGFRGSGR